MPSLTHEEIPLLPRPLNLTDGHVHRPWSSDEAALIARSAEFFASVDREMQPQLEARYVQATASFHRQCHDPARQGHLVCLTASQALEIVANHLRLHGHSLALVEPCFDNLANIFMRHEIPLTPLPDRLLETPDLGEFLRSTNATAICVVSPNNPTGRTLTQRNLAVLVEHCQRHGVLLVVDASFRAYTPRAQVYDQYAMLIDSGIDYAVIEDTGKTWPTLELKASILTSSAALHPALFDVYADFLLHSSPFTLRLLTEFVELSTADDGAHVRAIVATNREALARAVAGTALSLLGPTFLSVAWARVSVGTGERLARRLADEGVHVLAGDRFFWSDSTQGRAMVRIALTRDPKVFARGAEIIGRVAREALSA